MIALLDSFATILSYPKDEYVQRVEHCRANLAENSSTEATEALAQLDTFREAIRGCSIADLEELYTRTFDINPVSSLEVGWHLHGETYERGKFLVAMRDLLRRCGVEESSELPDHLTHVLMAVGRMREEEAEEFVGRRLLVALDKMLEGFAGKGNPYEHVLRAVRILLSQYAIHDVGA